MIPTNMKDLIRVILEKTKAKKAIWGKTSRPNEFKLSLEKGAVTADCWYDDRGAESVEFSIYNIYGDRIENFHLEKGDLDFDLLFDLHTEAKREFYKVDETIDSLFKEVNDDNNIGKRVIEKEDLPF